MTKLCYDVGYGKTAASHPLSQKANPATRKGAAKARKTRHYLHDGDEPIRDHHREREAQGKISKIAAAVTQLANDAARGDEKSIQLTFAWLQTPQPR